MRIPNRIVILVFFQIIRQSTCQKSRDEICAQPKIVGTCRALLPRFWFNPSTKECEEFFYGGCGANENNFKQEHECREMCGSQGSEAPVTTIATTTVASVQRSTDVCSLPKVVGDCRALLPRFWYNTATKQCEEFEYGGCDGNANNFKRKSQCIEACEQDTTEGPTIRRIAQDEEDLKTHHVKMDDENSSASHRGYSTLIALAGFIHVIRRQF